jgi:hypothetical protein
MSGLFNKYFKKLYVKQWVTGLSTGDVTEIIRHKSFDQNIKWLPVNSIDHFYADPFLLRTAEGKLSMLYEDFCLDDFYGNLSVMTFDENLKPASQKILLDTKSHLSYPFIFKEKGRIYIFPEASHSGKLSCYEYDPVEQSLGFVQDILNLPLLDSSILKYLDKYWLFATVKGEYAHSQLHIFFSENLFGPYNPHPSNPVKNSPNGSRPAGNFIEVDGEIYRPSQNCENHYGESITINKIIVLDEKNFSEEPYMIIKINEKNLSKYSIHAIHTFNVQDDIIAVDGIKWIFSPVNKWRNYLRNRKYFKQNMDGQTD